MPSATLPADAEIFDVSESDINAAIAACHGDPRDTIRALLIAYAMLERELSLERAWRPR